MKTNTRRLTAILVPLALLAGGATYSLVSSNKPTVAVATDKSQIAKVATISQNTAPVVKPTSVSSASPTSSPSSSPIAKKVAATTVKSISTATATPKKTPVKKTVIKVTVPKGSTIATRTGSGVQTVTVNTNKVTVSVNPSPAPATSSQDKVIYPAYGGTIITAAPDWNGFVAPKASFAGVLSCKKSTVLMQNPLSGNWEYPYLVSERWKFTDGNFIVDDSMTHYTPSDTYYATFTDEHFFTTNMNFVSTSPDDFIFRPFNWKGFNSSWPADTADTGRDISYHVTSTYTQSECQ